MKTLHILFAGVCLMIASVACNQAGQTETDVTNEVIETIKALEEQKK